MIARTTAAFLTILLSVVSYQGAIAADSSINVLSGSKKYQKLANKGHLTARQNQTMSNLLFTAGDPKAAQPFAQSFLDDLQYPRNTERKAKAMNNNALMQSDQIMRTQQLFDIPLSDLSPRTQSLILENRAESQIEVGEWRAGIKILQDLVDSPPTPRSLTPEEQAFSAWRIGDLLQSHGELSASLGYFAKAKELFKRFICPDQMAPGCKDESSGSLANYIVEIDNHGKLATTGGKLHSDPAQLKGIFANMNSTFTQWGQDKNGSEQHILLYAHGGMISEPKGLCTASRHTDWLLQNHIYPVSFIWRSSLKNALSDIQSDKLGPTIDSVNSMRAAGSMGFAGPVDLEKVAQMRLRGGVLAMASPDDPAIEALLGDRLRPVWDKMKSNAREASSPLADGITWKNIASQPADSLYGASAFAKGLGDYVDTCRRKGIKVHVHLFGHSAGSILHGYLLKRLAEAGVEIDSICLAAPAMRVDEFRTTYVDYLRTHKTCKLTVFELTDDYEQLDTVSICGYGYQKSILYFVSQALEKQQGIKDVPILGMANFKQHAVDAATDQANAANSVAIEFVTSPQSMATGCPTRAKHHSGFADDQGTMDCLCTGIVGNNNIVSYPEPPEVANRP